MKFLKILLLLVVVAAAGFGLYVRFLMPPMGGPPGGFGGLSGPMPVVVAAVQPRDVAIWQEFSARLEAVEFAEIRPQVPGIITDVRFEDGQEVVAGDILFVIDPRPYEAAMKAAQADVKQAETRLALAQKEVERARQLIVTEAVSKRLLDQRESEVNAAFAGLQAAKAALQQAKINLDYAFVKAPITGRAGRVEVKRGNVVEAGATAPVLTSVVSRDRIYADFEVDERTYLEFVRSGVRDREGEGQIPIQLRLAEGGGSYDGTIYSFDNQLDVMSGTIRARALFENADGALLPGMFATVRLGGAQNGPKIVVSEAAIGTDQARRFVYVVDNENMVQYRQVQLGYSVDGGRVITQGLVAGDQVITEGIIRIRPGMSVKPMSAEQVQVMQQQGAPAGGPPGAP